MGTDGQHHSGCLFPFGDNFLATLLFFFNVDNDSNEVSTIKKVDLNSGDPIDEDQDEEDQDWDESNFDDKFDSEDDWDSDED